MRSVNVPPHALDDDRERTWVDTLIGASAAFFVVNLGAFVASPLIPSLIYQEFGIREPGQVAFWAGLSVAVTPFVNAFASPLWGMVGDRFGRRDLLARAVAAAAFSIGAVAAVQNVTQLFVLRAVQGAIAGVPAAATAVVASETPPRHLARAIGILTSSRSLGQTIGPAIGALAGTVLPIRAVFGGSGLLVLLGLVPVFAKVRETQRPLAGARLPSIGAAIRGAGAEVRRAVVVLIGSQALTQFAVFSGSQLILVRAIEIDAARAVLGGGLAYAALSLASTLAGVLYAGLVPRLGYRSIAVVSTLVLGAAVFLAAAATDILQLVVAAALAGAGSGAHVPATSAMLGLETPGEVKGTVFGFSASAQSLGQGVGAVTGGAIAIAFGPSGALAAVATAALASAVVLLWSREPAPTRSPEPAR